MPKRKKAGLDTRLSCKIDYFSAVDQLDPSDASGFFTAPVYFREPPHLLRRRQFMA
jgi:hypothetical protein